MKEHNDEFVMVQTTSNDQNVLEKLARQLVQQRLAACVQVGGPIQSCFMWEGKIDSAKEWLCSIKTTRRALARVEQVIREGHNYDLPEVIVLPIIGGSEAYINWLRDSVAG